jgi:hypothetical protein
LGYRFYIFDRYVLPAIRDWLHGNLGLHRKSWVYVQPDQFP